MDSPLKINVYIAQNFVSFPFFFRTYLAADTEGHITERYIIGYMLNTINATETGGATWEGGSTSHRYSLFIVCLVKRTLYFLLTLITTTTTIATHPSQQLAISFV